MLAVDVRMVYRTRFLGHTFALRGSRRSVKGLRGQTQNS